jgi:hypothetical protein
LLKGVELCLDSGRTLIVRISRSDVDWPGYDGYPFHVVLSEAKLEAAIYQLLQSDNEVLASGLIVHRLRVLRSITSADIPPVVDEGRCLFVFEKAKGSNNVWRELDGTQKVCSFPNASIPPVTYFLRSTISYSDVLTFE